MPADTSQAQLWSHIQNERTCLFAGSKTRLDKLLRLAKYTVHGRTLLNIGCGDGYLERKAHQQNWQVISVDPDARSLEQLKSAGIDARGGTIESLPLDSGSVNVVICTEVLEHLTPASMEAGLKEISRVLVSGGMLIGTVPYRENLQENEVFCPDCKKTFHRWGHQQAFDESRVRSTLAGNFTVERVRPAYFIDWRTLNWKGMLIWLARFAFSVFGVYGANANILFIARKNIKS